MKKWNLYIATLLILNVNSLIFGMLSSYFGRIIDLWSLSHYFTYSILLLLCSKIIRTTDFKSRFVKGVFVSSVIISLLTLIAGWYLSTLNIKSTIFIYVFISQLTLGLLTFFMTLYCKRYSSFNADKDENPKISIRDGIKYGSRVIIGQRSNESHIENIIKCSILASIVFILIIILYIIIPPILKQSDNRNSIILFSIPIIFGLILINDYKNKLYYKKNIYLKLTILETILILTGISFLFFFQGFVYHKTHFTNFYVLIIPIAMLYSILNTNYKISKEYHRIINDKKRKELQ
ncbi:hypothetical protein [Fonticella tunisiensis]|uniref:Uncharacterized protein n=1 Tax=Fonticella tunisiensis TaxID=1096341 RepID=A0A4R7KL03_9CLOT|nr:hypothetical protein [Fonticella tunisiensis]TDT57222.1 hypothetical protein EDD71_1121 [Fonticella tunisiensis]